MDGREVDPNLRPDRAAIVRLADQKLDQLGEMLGDQRPDDDGSGDVSGLSGLQKRYLKLFRFVTANTVPVDTEEATGPTEEELAEKAKEVRLETLGRVHPSTRKNLDKAIAHLAGVGGIVEIGEDGKSPAVQIKEGIGLDYGSWDRVRTAGARTGVINVNKHDPEEKKGNVFKSITLDLDIAEEFAEAGVLSKGTMKAINELRQKREAEPDQPRQAEEQPEDSESLAPLTLRDDMIAHVRAKKIERGESDERTRTTEELKEVIKLRFEVEGERFSLRTTLKLLGKADEPTRVIALLETARQMPGKNAPKTDDQIRRFVLDKMNAGRNRRQTMHYDDLASVIEDTVTSGELSMNGSGSELPALTPQGLQRVKEAGIKQIKGGWF